MNKKTIFIASILQVALIISLGMVGFSSSQALAKPASGPDQPMDAAWYDLSWNYRRPVTVSNPLATALLDYQVKLVLDSSFEFSQAKNDGSDLRLTASDGITLIPFWIEKWDPAGQSAIVWAKVPSLPAGDSSIYFYYGNASATALSNGEATFELFDDFSQGGSSNPGSNWQRVVIDNDLDGAHNVNVEDIDGDDRPDILSDGYRDNNVVWYQQPEDPVNDPWAKFVVDANITNVHDAMLGDIDGDGGRDIVAVSLSESWTDYNLGNGSLVWYQKPDDPTMVGSTGWTARADRPYAAADGSAAVYASEIYVFGGHGLGGADPRAESFKYSPSSNSWATLASMPTARWGHIAVEFNGLIHVFSGYTGLSTPTGVHEIYNPLMNTWQSPVLGNGPANVPTELADQGLMGIRYNDRIHLFYKQYHFEYDPVTDTYTRKADVPTPRTWATCALVDNMIYLIGGYSYGTPSGATNVNEVYDPSNDTWASSTPMPVSKYGATRENPVINGKIYVTHGLDGGFHADNYVYDPLLDTWTQKSTGIHPRDGVESAVVNQKLYVIGGRDDYISGGTGRNYVEEYDPALDVPTFWVKTTIASSGNTGLLGARTLGLGDIDLDGDLDVAVAVDRQTFSTTGKLFWYQNPGGSDALNPALWNEYLIDETQGCGADARIADIDRDGHPDIVYGGNTGSPANIFVYFGPQDPTNVSGWTRVAVAEDAYHANLIDFDDDGDLDIIRASAGDSLVSWLENPYPLDPRTRANWHEYIIEHSVNTTAAIQALAADIDGDGDLDIGMASHSSRNDGIFQWYRRPADPKIVSAWGIYVVDNNPTYTAWSHDATLADLDLDGDIDMLGVGATANTVVWWINNPSVSDPDPSKWNYSGANISDGILTLSGPSRYLRSLGTYQYKAVRSKSRFETYASYGYIGFNTAKLYSGGGDINFVCFATPTVQSIASNAAGYTWGYSLNEGTDWKTWEVQWQSNQAQFFVDDALRYTHTTYIPTVPLYAQLSTYTGSPTIRADWILVRNLVSPEPGTLIGPQETYAGPSAPEIVSVPITTAAANVLYSYDVSATGDPIPTYTLLTNPTGMSIQATSGLIQWTPTAEQVGGPHTVIVAATNSQGTDTQEFTILVAGIGPTLYSPPVLASKVGETYSYDAQAIGTPAPTYSLTEYPAGMTINTITGVIQWSPLIKGVYNVTLQASNPAGTDTQSFHISVAEGFVPRLWTHRYPITISNTGNPNALTNYPVLISLDSSNFNFSFAQSGAQDIRFTDSDFITVIDHWVEAWNYAAQSASIWVEIPYIPANGSAVIYLYVGNATASSTNDGVATFDFFDDFNPDVLGSWQRVVVDSALDGSHNIMVEDVNTDGKLDIVADAYRAQVVVWYEQPADPVNGVWTKRTIDSNLGNAHDFQIGDIDGDGRRDVIGLSLSTSWTDYSAGVGYVAWYQKPLDPTGAWTKTIIASSGATGLLGSRTMGLGDIDSDGDLDIAVAVDRQTFSTIGKLFWYQNPGGSNALNPALWHEYLIDETQGCGADAQIGDIDKDGLPDIVYAGNAGSPANLFVYFAPDDPTNVGGWNRVALTGTTYHVRLVDFDGDGDLDIIRASALGSLVSWLENPYPLDPRTPANWHEYVIENNATINIANQVNVADIDGDGDLDIGMDADPSGTTGTFKWYRRPDDPKNVAAYEIYVVDNNSSYTAYSHDSNLADIDGDGDPDMVGVGPNAQGGTVMWYVNTKTTGLTTRWVSGGTPTIANSIVTINAASEYIRSGPTFLNMALRSRARFETYGSYSYVGYNHIGNYNAANGTALFYSASDNLIRSITSIPGSYTNGYVLSEGTNWKLWDVLWRTGEVRFVVDGANRFTHTTNIPTTPLVAQINDFTGSPIVSADWLFVHKYTVPEPTYLLGSEGPTAVTVSSFTGASRIGTVQLDWETASEVGLVGFNLYRSATLAGVKQKLNTDLIPAQYPDQMLGATYQFSDTVEQGQRYYYWLEIVRYDGIELLGPAIVDADYLVRLPFMVR